MGCEGAGGIGTRSRKGKNIFYFDCFMGVAGKYSIETLKGVRANFAGYWLGEIYYTWKEESLGGGVK